MKLRATFQATLAKGDNGVALLDVAVYETTKKKLVDALLKEVHVDDEELENVSIDLAVLPHKNGIYACTIDYFFAQGKDRYGNIEALEDQHLFVVQHVEEKPFC